MLRLAKYMAELGVASRRKSEELIAQGRVSVNGVIITERGHTIDPGRDIVAFDGQTIEPVEKVYILLYKPAGYISSVIDPWGRPTVTELIREKYARIYPVGRLDFDTEGLLLLTNDGDFANFIIHPRYKIDKKYEALVDGQVQAEAVKLLQNGIRLDDGLTAPARVRILKRSGRQTWLEIIIHEGRKRQVKKMLSAVGHPVIKLKRTAIAFLTLQGLEAGEYRHLSHDEVQRLLRISQQDRTS